MNVEMDIGRCTTGTGSEDLQTADPIFQAANPIFSSTNINHNNTENTNTNTNTNTNPMNITTNNNNTNNTKRVAMMRMRRSRRNAGGRKQGASSGRFGGRRQRRLWQLPKSSIDEYTKWIQEKPEEDQTPSEQRFLWKCMIQSLGVVGNHNQNNGTTNAVGSGPVPMETKNKRSRQERIREFVDRLEAKEAMELTDNEEQFVRLYHKRRKDRKAQRHQRKQQQQDDGSTVSWMRGDGNHHNNDTNSNNININDNSSSSCNRKNVYGNHKSNRKNHNKNKAGFEPQASLESLRESMNKMGLSSDKLKQVRFADQQIG